MNEEQLKEIAILAKELGFKPKTLSTGVTFEKFTRVDKGLPINDTCYYLLLCEIQKWLREVHLLDIRISNYFNKAGDNILIYNQEVFFIPDKFEETPDDETEYETYEQALSVSILECLTLLKNENN